MEMIEFWFQFHWNIFSNKPAMVQVIWGGWGEGVCVCARVCVCLCLFGQERLQNTLPCWVGIIHFDGHDDGHCYSGAVYDVIYM